MPSEINLYEMSGLDHSDQTYSARSTSAKSSIYSTNGMRGHRPKSSPTAAGYRQTSGQQSKISRPKTAAVILGRTECSRVHQLEHEPTRRHNLESHLPLKRNKPPPWQKILESPLVPFKTGPGYILSRSKTKCHITIKDEFFDPVHEENTYTSQGDERDNLINQLQQQISDLTLYLEEERLNHKQTKQNAEEFYRDKVEQLNSQHQEHIKDLEADHQEEMNKQKQVLEQEHKEVQNILEKQISKMAKEIEFLQSAFDSYKSSLHSETSEKLKEKEDEMRLKFAAEKQQAMHEMRTKLIHEKNQERAKVEKEHKQAIDALRKENKRELDSLLRRFSNAAADIEKLKKVTVELEETKQELESVKESYNTTCLQLASTTRLLTDSKVRLMEYEERFQEKVALVDDKYRHKLQDLMTQNTELKRLFVQKCGELFDEKTHTDHQTQLQVKTAKETMQTLIKSKTRANVSVVLGAPQQIHHRGKHRPVSAPATREETQAAHNTAGNVELQPEGEFVSPDIHLNLNSKTEELRAELFSSR